MIKNTLKYLLTLTFPPDYKHMQNLSNPRAEALGRLCKPGSQVTNLFLTAQWQAAYCSFGMKHGRWWKTSSKNRFFSIHLGELVPNSVTQYKSDPLQSLN